MLYQRFEPCGARAKLSLDRLRSEAERYLPQILGVLTLAVSLVWLASTLFDPLQQWLSSSSLLNVIIIVLLSDVLLLLAEFKSTATPPVAVFRDEPDAYRDLRRYIESSSPRQADLIEYSTATIHDLLELLRSASCRLRILICNPDSAVNEFQATRIRERIADLTTVTFRDFDKVDIRMYRLPAAIRGRLIDDTYVTMGWHVYTSDAAGLYGHTHAMVSASCDSMHGRNLRATFTDAFEHLWEAPTTTVLLAAGRLVDDEPLALER
jgi:hypothetical protein